MTIRLHLAALLAGMALVACKTAGNPAPSPTVSSPGAATKASPQGASGEGAASITPPLIARGDSVFHGATCTDCHGRNAKGTPHGPDLTSGNFAQTDGSYGEIVRIITTGVPEDKITDPTFPEPMPARGGVKPPLTDDQIRAVAAYVYSLSHR